MASEAEEAEVGIMAEVAVVAVVVEVGESLQDPHSMQSWRRPARYSISRESAANKILETAL